ncbi:E set domain-containing protein [Ramicandelaber brevisporus]|nr:E set domain-containing protein [Ramicandelaber brevisporus]
MAQVVLLNLTVIPTGRPDISVDTSNPVALLKLADSPIGIKEGTEYTRKVSFKVSGAAVKGLKYTRSFKRAGVTLKTGEDILGDFEPREEAYETSFAADTAPSGFIARGKYEVASQLEDADGKVLYQWTWYLEIKKDW